MEIHVKYLRIEFCKKNENLFLDFSFNEITGHEDTLANEEDKQATNNGSLTHFPRISNQ